MRRKLLAAACMAVLAVGGATLAWAATSSDSNTIDACVAKNGKVSIYASGQSCLSSERKVSWNVQGPQGAQGPQGPPGDANPNAVPGTITITGNGFAGVPASAIIAVSHEIVSPRDPATGLATGKRQHKPFTITKQLDKSTPLLMQALATNQTLTSVLIGLLAPGSTTPYATVKLTNAQVSDTVQQGGTQTVSFTYQKITWTYISADGSATTFEDDWEAPVS